MTYRPCRQPASIGALPVAIARACGHQVAYLPGLVMRRLADLHPGTAKTDARDAYVIADAPRTLPHTLRRVDTGDDTLAELEVLVGYDDDLAGEVTRISNRIRGLLTQIYPPWNGSWARNCSTRRPRCPPPRPRPRRGPDPLRQRHRPSTYALPGLAINHAWCTAAAIAVDPLAWLQLLALDGDLARAEPKRLGYRVLHTAARLVHGQRRRRLRTPSTSPWAVSQRGSPLSELRPKNPMRRVNRSTSSMPLKRRWR